MSDCRLSVAVITDQAEDKIEDQPLQLKSFRKYLGCRRQCKSLRKARFLLFVLHVNDNETHFTDVFYLHQWLASIQRWGEVKAWACSFANVPSITALSVWQKGNLENEIQLLWDEKKNNTFVNDTDLSLRKLNKLQKSILEIQNKQWECNSHQRMRWSFV